MTKKQENISTTYREILVLAIHEIEREIGEYEEKITGNTPEAQSLLSAMTKPLEDKLENIKTLYLIETGCEYN